jgi:hypothetical protein
MRDLLKEIEAEPPELGDEELEEFFSKWLRSVDEKVHPISEFVAGSFSQHVAAWEEFPANFSRPASRSVLSWIRGGIKPSFAGTEQCDLLLQRCCWIASHLLSSHPKSSRFNLP